MWTPREGETLEGEGIEIRKESDCMEADWLMNPMQEEKEPRQTLQRAGPGIQSGPDRRPASGAAGGSSPLFGHRKNLGGSQQK